MKLKLKKNLEKILIGVVFTIGTIMNVMAGNLEVRHYTSEQGITKQAVVIEDNGSDGRYIEPNFPPQPALIAYTKDPNGTKLKVKGINPEKTEEVKIYFDANNVVDVNHFIRLRFIDPNSNFPDMNDYSTRNLTLRQDPNNHFSDPNLYDILDLTELGTKTAYIHLDINNYKSQWICGFYNYADLDFNGEVDFYDFSRLSSNWKRQDCNSSNNWCNFSDLNKNGVVDINDLYFFSNEWLYNSLLCD